MGDRCGECGRDWPESGDPGYREVGQAFGDEWAIRLADSPIATQRRQFWERCAAAALTSPEAHCDRGGDWHSKPSAAESARVADAMLAEWDKKWGDRKPNA